MRRPSADREPRQMSRATRTPIERVSADDLMQKALEVGPLPMHIGAVLVLDGELAVAPSGSGGSGT